MRGYLALALLAACSFQATSKASVPVDSAADAVVASDAAHDAQPTVDAAAPDAAVLVTCPADYAAIAGAPAASKYKLYSYSAGQDQRNSWTTAVTTCMGTHTHLVIVETSAEAIALGAALQFAPGSPYFWEGVTDEGHEATWDTVLGAPATYLPWAPQQPNGGTQANCALFDQASMLYDYACDGFQPFACECE